MYVFGYSTITFIVSFTFMNLLNVGAFVQIFNFFVMFKTKFQEVDWKCFLKVGASIVINFIYPLLSITTLCQHTPSLGFE